MKRILLTLVAVLSGGCSAPDTGTIQPHLAFTIGPEAGLSAARDLTVDRFGNLFVFDYDDYLIHKFDPSGGALGTFGGSVDGNGDFHHLMAIRVVGDSLLALDAGSLSVFDLSGRLLSHRPFSDTIVCDLPRLRPDGEWAAEWIIDASAEKALTHRDSDGGELARVASYELGEFFPGVVPGGFFFINPTQARSYLYDFLPNGSLVWAASDVLEVNGEDGGEESHLFEAEALPRPFPSAEIQTMREEQANLSPPLFMNVPETYQIIQHLLVDEDGDLWVYVMTTHRTGFLRLTDEGDETGFFAVEADFDLGSARVAAGGGRLYFLVGARNETRIYTVDRP